MNSMNSLSGKKFLEDQISSSKNEEITQENDLKKIEIAHIKK